MDEAASQGGAAAIHDQGDRCTGLQLQHVEYRRRNRSITEPPTFRRLVVCNDASRV
jgi:hypothetical protein